MIDTNNMLRVSLIKNYASATYTHHYYCTANKFGQTILTLDGLYIMRYDTRDSYNAIIYKSICAAKLHR
jgi:hypothetical protein|nr:MAG TPA: hypothetical protein [Caudoviricetes sp.]